MPAALLSRLTALLLALASLCLAAEVSQLTLLHVNDLHARLLPDENGIGGFAHLKTAIDREIETSESALVLHAGDMVQGSPVSTIFEGTPLYEVASEMGFDAHCLGNHEFDYGWKKIREFEEASGAPIVAANVTDPDGRHLVRPYVMLDAGGVQVAVIGALTPRLPRLIKPVQAGNWVARPLVEGLRSTVEALAPQADLVVVLGHLFDDEDELVLRELPEVDVLVGGHDHGGRDEPLVIDGRLGVKLRPYGRELGRLDLSVDTERGQVISHEWRRIPIRTSLYPADPAVAELVERWESKVSNLVDVSVGQCARPLSRSEIKALIETALRETTGAEVAYMNRGGVRDSLSAGTVTARHIWNILPFDNEIVETELTGADLQFAPDLSEVLEPDRRYRFVTNDYVAGLEEYRNLQFRPVGVTLRDAFLEWVKERGRVP